MKEVFIMDMDVSSSFLTNEFFDVVGGCLKTRYIYLCNMETNVSKWSKNAVDFFGLPGEFMYNANWIWTTHIHPDDLEGYNNQIRPIFSGEKRILKQSTVLWIKMATMCCVRDAVR